MRRWLCALSVVCLCGVLSADAQIVRIGPHGGVRVRAPFTSVDVLPYGGGTRVRAPFTAVDTGLYQYGVVVPHYVGHPHHYAVPVYPVAPVYPVPIYPVPVYPEYVYPEIVYPEPVYQTPPPPHDAARPIVGILEDRLRAAAVRLQYGLSLRRDDGDVWQNYLSPQSIVDVIDQGGDPKTLSDLLRSYNGVVANPALTSIRSTAGFSETRKLLKEYIERPKTNILPPRASSPVPPPVDQLPPQPDVPQDDQLPNAVPPAVNPAAEDVPKLEELPPPAATDDAAKTPVIQKARARKPIPL